MINNKGVSHVVGFVLIFILTVSLLTATIYTANISIETRRIAVAKLKAKSIANEISDAILDAITVKRFLPESKYKRTIYLPHDIGGFDYYVEVTDSAVYVNSTDGRISERSTTYNAEEFGIGISGKVYSGEGHLEIVCEKSSPLYRLDFGTPSSADMGGDEYTDHSPVEIGYFRVSNLTKIGECHADVWWNTSWLYRVPIFINNTSPYNDTYAEDLQNYTLQLIVTPPAIDYRLANKSGYDIVFVDPSTNNVLPHWIERWNDHGTSVIWVKVDSIPANSTKVIYMYYGKEGTCTPSEGSPEDVFLFFDHFTSYSSKWHLSGNVFFSSSKAFIGRDGGIVTADDIFECPDPPLPLPGKSTSSEAAYSVRVKFKLDYNLENDGSIAILAQSSDAQDFYESSYLVSSNLSSLVLSKMENGAATTIDVSNESIAKGTWQLSRTLIYIYKIWSWEGSSIRKENFTYVYTDRYNYYSSEPTGDAGPYIENSSYGSPYTGGYFGLSYGVLNEYSGNLYPFKIDWVAIRKVPSVEPMVTFGVKESIVYGWQDINDIESNDRGGLDLAGRDFNEGTQEKIFVIDHLDPGTYSLTVICGDSMKERNNITIQVSDDGGNSWKKLVDNLTIRAGDFARRWTVLNVSSSGIIMIKFDCYKVGQSWLVNAIELEEGIKGIRVI